MIQYRMHFKTEQSHFFNTKNELLDIINKLTLNFWLSAKELHLSKSVIAVKKLFYWKLKGVTLVAIVENKFLTLKFNKKPNDSRQPRRFFISEYWIDDVWLY